MEYISRTVQDGIARVVIRRGKVNAFNDAVIDEMSRTFGELALDPSVRAITLTGTGKFFSFGFDIPQFLGYNKEQFTRYLTASPASTGRSSSTRSRWWRCSTVTRSPVPA